MEGGDAVHKEAKKCFASAVASRIPWPNGRNSCENFQQPLILRRSRVDLSNFPDGTRYTRRKFPDWYKTDLEHCILLRYC